MTGEKINMKVVSLALGFLIGAGIAGPNSIKLAAVTSVKLQNPNADVSTPSKAPLYCQILQREAQIEKETQRRKNLTFNQLRNEVYSLADTNHDGALNINESFSLYEKMGYKDPKLNQNLQFPIPNKNQLEKALEAYTPMPKSLK